MDVSFEQIIGELVVQNRQLREALKEAHMLLAEARKTLEESKPEEEEKDN